MSYFIESTEKLQKIADELRMTIIEMLFQAGSGHPGGSLSICEILSVLYYWELKNLDPQNPSKADRDRFILSKGHAAPALYAILAKRGYFPEADLKTLRKFGSKLQGHPDMTKVKGVEISSGSLGMGISFGIGTALASRVNHLSYRVYVLTGCGEMDEGQNWEAFMAGFKYHLDNLTVIVDYNKVQLDGTNEEIMPLGSLEDKIAAFGWNIIHCDGHNIQDLMEAFTKARQMKGKPTAILAHTIKGRGISFMENKSDWHGKTVDESCYRQAVKELGGDKG